MDVDDWLTRFGKPVSAAELGSAAAAQFVSFVERYAARVATLVELRQGNQGDLVVIDFETGRPQKSAYPIDHVERIGVRFADEETMPLVYVLRADFPDTAHQTLTPQSHPRAICIDDRTWAEARLTWTPAELVERILTWFSRAATGELHDARQPLDPLLAWSHLKFIIPRDVLQETESPDLVALHNEANRESLRIRPVNCCDELSPDKEPICLVAYHVPLERMQRLSSAPETLGDLEDMLSDRGIEFLGDLKLRFATWLANEEYWRILSRFAVIVEMPIIAPDSSEQRGTDIRAFVTCQSVGDIAVALGVAFKSEQSRVGYTKALLSREVDNEGPRSIEVQSAEVHYEFDRELATQLRGRSEPDMRRVVMVGAGAIGSHIAECLAREGRFCWTIIDNDQLLPHNLARHTGRAQDVVKNKARLLEEFVSGTIHSPDPVACGIATDVMNQDAASTDVDRALGETELIVDTTASVLAARYLSDHPAMARRVSLFFNPSGDAAALIAEPVDRSLTLRDLEAQYLGIVAREEALAEHLSSEAGRYAYTGACRAITNLIPESHVMALSGLVSDGLSKTVDQNGAAIKIWSMSDSGAVEVFETEPTTVESFTAKGWTVTFDRGFIDRIREMRAAQLPEETGGVLVGIVDIPAKCIHLVDGAPAPADSICSDTGFIRGTGGVREYLDRISERTRGHVRYVGEWHSHPPKAGTHPSSTDVAQLDWLASLFNMDRLPALMLIAGDEDVRVLFVDQQAEPVHQSGQLTL